MECLHTTKSFDPDINLDRDPDSYPPSQGKSNFLSAIKIRIMCAETEIKCSRTCIRQKSGRVRWAYDNNAQAHMVARVDQLYDDNGVNGVQRLPLQPPDANPFDNL